MDVKYECPHSSACVFNAEMDAHKICERCGECMYEWFEILYIRGKEGWGVGECRDRIVNITFGVESFTKGNNNWRLTPYVVYD
jgi:hypothetical protein